MSLKKDKRGAALVEFALVCVPFFAILIAILNTSLVFFAQQSLDSVAESMARGLVTGQTQTAAPSQTAFRTATCAKLPAYLQCANLVVDLRKASNFSDIDTRSPTIGTDANGNTTGNRYELGGPGDIVVLRLMYTWPLPSTGLGPDLSTSAGKRVLIATSIGRAEQYS